MCYIIQVMQKETQMRALSERVLQSTLTSMAKRPLPVSGHQAAADLYDAVDRYTDAVNANNLPAAHKAALKLATEALRVLTGYEIPATPSGVDRVHVENISSAKTQVKA